MIYDVTIVGAGPAGSTAAKYLAEDGFNVVLIDKCIFPRDKPCGGALTSRVSKRFDYLKEKDIIESYSYGVSAYSQSLKYKVFYERDKPLIGMVLRKKFDKGLLDFAIENGVIFKGGNAVYDIKILDNKAKIFLKDGSIIESEMIIGADGVWSIIAKKTGLTEKGKKGICIFHEYELSEEILDKYFNESRLYYIHARFNNLLGYGWVFPKKKHLNIGVGEIFNKRKNKDEKRINLLKNLDFYIKFLKDNKIIPTNLKSDIYKGGVLPIKVLNKTYSNRVILVGDACGFINPVIGEGIYYAMSSGEIASKTTTQALEESDFSEQFLSIYQKRWKEDFGKDLDLLNKGINESKNSEEELFKIASKDQKLAELLIGIITGELSIFKNKWKIVKRYLYASTKNKFS